MTLSRRSFSKGLLSLPLLESIGRTARAAGASGSLTRVIFYVFHNAWYEDVVFPRSPTYLTGPEGVRYLPLSQLTGDLSTLFPASKYSALKSKMNIMRGFDLLSASQGGGGHRALYALGASDERSSAAAADTIDTVISNASQFYPTAPFRRLLNASTANDTGSGYNFSYQGGAPRSQLRGPSQLFTEFFSGALPGMTPPMMASDPNLARRVALLTTQQRLRTLAGSPRLAMTDQRRLTQHADVMTALIDGLAPAATTPAVMSCSRPTNTTLAESMNAPGAQRRIRLVLDEVYMALACQLTNVVTLQPVNADDAATLVTDGGANEVYHQMAGHHHDLPRYLPAKTFLFDQLLYLLNRMDSTQETNGRSMLDNSLVVVVSNDGCGTHSSWDMPVVTFGSLGGRLRTGNYINYQRPTAPSLTSSLDLVNAPDAAGRYRYDYELNLGRPLGQFYATVLNVLGIPHSGFGEYTDPDGHYAAFTSSSGRRASLPVLT